MNFQRLLHDWYGMDYEPKVRSDGQAMIAVLEQARPGAEFDHAFLEVFSRHHFMLMEPVNGCVTATELKHADLRRECRSMWQNQTADIDMMRHELEDHFGIADYQPFDDKEPLVPYPGSPRGQHSGHEPR